MPMAYSRYGLRLLFVLLFITCVWIRASATDPELNSTNLPENETTHGNLGPSPNISTGLAVYRQVLRGKRMEQRKSILMLHDIQDLKKQGKLSKPAIDKILEILDQRRQLPLPNVTDFGSLSPAEREVISLILENLLFLSDFTLRLPDSTAKLLKKISGAPELIHWALAYATSLDVLEETDLKALNLMAQELNIIPRSEGYVNVYSESYKRQQAEEEKRAAKEAAKTKKPEKKKKEKPLMSGQFHGEL